MTEIRDYSRLSRMTDFHTNDAQRHEREIVNQVDAWTPVTMATDRHDIGMIDDSTSIWTWLRQPRRR